MWQLATADTEESQFSSSVAHYAKVICGGGISGSWALRFAIPDRRLESVTVHYARQQSEAQLFLKRGSALLRIACVIGLWGIVVGQAGAAGWWTGDARGSGWMWPTPEGACEQQRSIWQYIYVEAIELTGYYGERECIFSDVPGSPKDHVYIHLSCEDSISYGGSPDYYQGPIGSEVCINGNWPSPACVVGETWDLSTGRCIAQFAERNLGADLGCKATQVCDSIEIGLGNKTAVETDYASLGPDPISFTRYYNSDSRARAGSIGTKWRHSYDRELVTDGSVARLYRPDGSVLGFSSANGVWSPNVGFRAQLVAIGSGYEVRLPQGTVETYDGQGLLQTITDQTGNVQTISRDSSGRITQVTSALGNFLILTYGATGLGTVTDNAGRSWRYSIDAGGLLTQLTLPDGSTRIYQYESADDSSGLLSGVVDERGVQVETFGYEISSATATSTSHANNVESRTVVYHEDGIRLVTDSLGRVKSYVLEERLGAMLPTRIIW